MDVISSTLLHRDGRYSTPRLFKHTLANGRRATPISSSDPPRARSTSRRRRGLRPVGMAARAFGCPATLSSDNSIYSPPAQKQQKPVDFRREFLVRCLVCDRISLVHSEFLTATVLNGVRESLLCVWCCPRVFVLIRSGQPTCHESITAIHSFPIWRVSSIYTRCEV